MSNEDNDSLNHETYGHYNETPHADIDLTFQQWHEVVKPVLEFQIGPPVAWLYEGGMLFVWGENLDGSLIRDIADACNDAEREHADDGFYEAAEAARGAASWIVRADVYPPGEKVIT